MTQKNLRCLYFLLLVSTGLFGQSSKRPFIGWAILQGPTSQTETVFAVLHDRDEVLSACAGISVDACLFKPKDSIKKSHPSSTRVISHFVFRGLQNALPLKLKIEDTTGRSDVRDFRLLKNTSSVKFAVASCMDDTMTDLQEPMWRGLLEKKADVLFLIGDNTYADKHLKRGEGATPEILWRRHEETREILHLFRSASLIPTYAVWDDHDYGKNDAGGEYPFKGESREIFYSYFPQRENSLLKLGAGVSSILTLADQDFFFLDDRSFRTIESHWGAEQEEWLLKNLKSNRAPAWLINGNQIFGGYHKFESYERLHPESFKKFLERLRNVNRTVNFISGDRHLAEVMRIDKKEFGREAYELTSSGIHAKVFPGSWDRNKNPRQVEGVSGEYNYMIVESKREKKGLSVSLTVYGKDKKFFDYQFVAK